MIWFEYWPMAIPPRPGPWKGVTVMVTIQLTLPDVYVYTCEKTGLSTNIDCKKTPVESHLAAWTIGVREKFDNCHASETLKKYNDGVVPVKDSAEHKRAWNARIPAVKKILADYLVAWYAGNPGRPARDRKSTRLNSSHLGISYAVFCLKKK